MGVFDNADIYELIGTFIQSNLTNIINKEDLGLYRNGGLGIFKNISRPEIERKKKGIVKKVSLSKAQWEPHLHQQKLKPPTNILIQLPKSITKCISETSSSEEIFNKSNKIYNNVLKKSGSSDDLKYSPNEVQ